MAALTGHRWVTFDCYGTLIDWQAGFTAALARVAGDKTPALVRAYHVREREVEAEKPHASYKDVLATALVRAAADVGVRLSAADARILRQSWGGLRPFADVEPLLAELRRRGWRLAVLTNCDDDLFEITHRTFRMPFDLFLTAERVRGYKPALWHFRAFELLTRVDRRDWVHVASQLVPRHRPRASARRDAGVARPRAHRRESGWGVAARSHGSRRARGDRVPRRVRSWTAGRPFSFVATTSAHAGSKGWCGTRGVTRVNVPRYVASDAVCSPHSGSSATCARVENPCDASVCSYAAGVEARMVQRVAAVRTSDFGGFVKAANRGHRWREYL